MAFTCRCCGFCCSTMGEIIGIREQIAPGRFRIGFTNGEERIVSLDKGREAYLGSVQDRPTRSSACPFLMPLGPDRRICIVHDSRPDICRDYLCSRILVLDAGGNRAGRVLPGTRSFTTTDSTLLSLWQSSLRDCAIHGEEDWERMVEDTFTRAGYRVIR